MLLRDLITVAVLPHHRSTPQAPPLRTSPSEPAAGPPTNSALDHVALSRRRRSLRPNRARRSPKTSPAKTHRPHAATMSRSRTIPLRTDTAGLHVLVIVVRSPAQQDLGPKRRSQYGEMVGAVERAKGGSDSEHWCERDRYCGGVVSDGMIPAGCSSGIRACVCPTFQALMMERGEGCDLRLRSFTFSMSRFWRRIRSQIGSTELMTESRTIRAVFNC